MKRSSKEIDFIIYYKCSTGGSVPTVCLVLTVDLVLTVCLVRRVGSVRAIGICRTVQKEEGGGIVAPPPLLPYVGELSYTKYFSFQI